MVTMKGKLIDLTLNITSLTFPSGLLFVVESKGTCGRFFQEISFNVITINDNTLGDITMEKLLWHHDLFI